nr:MAG TPA: putative mRNA interferase toxin [Caudoviricetes sp.]
MTINDFKEALNGLGFSIERGSNHCYVVRGNDTFAKISRWRMRYVDTYYSATYKLEEKEGLALMAAVFEFANTPVAEREDKDYRVYVAYEESEFVGQKLYVTGYGKSGERLALDTDISTSLWCSYNRAVEVAEHVSKIVGKKFEIEEVDNDD